MGTLIRFELKKILGNRVGMATCVLAFGLLLVFSVLNLMTASVRDYDTGTMQSGLDAQQSLKKEIESNAGPLTDERIAQSQDEYESAKTLSESVPDFEDLSSEQIIEKYGLEFWQDTLGVMNQNLLLVLQPVVTANGNGGPFQFDSLEDAVAASIEKQLNQGFSGEHPYSDAEREYWHEKEAQFEWPLQYGYANGWANILNCLVAYMGLAIAALCIAISGVFAGEYQQGTAAVVLPTRRGKKALPLAKVIAAFVFASAFWWLCVGMVLAVNFAGCGADGAGLPMQVMGFTLPYALSMGQAVLYIVLLGYLVALGMTGATLLLSSVVRSTMPAAVIPLCAIFLGLLGLFLAPVVKIAALTPASALNYSFSRMVFYAAGPVVLDLPTAVTLLYGILLLAGVPLAIRAFRRHQMA